MGSGVHCAMTIIILLIVLKPFLNSQKLLSSGAEPRKTEGGPSEVMVHALVPEVVCRSDDLQP